MKPWVNLLLCSMISISAACGDGDGDGDGDGQTEDPDATETAVMAKDTPPFACGGLLGIGCPADYTCADDFRDDCDPQNGGADCPGLCQHPKGAAACDPSDPVCGANEVCVDNPWLDCVAAPCPTGTCVLADCTAAVGAYDCALTVRCAPGYAVHHDGCNCSCQPYP
ncbi:MAG: hypothetical protein WKG00_31840 [Polyangiaceae bacterium]